MGNTNIRYSLAVKTIGATLGCGMLVLSAVSATISQEHSIECRSMRTLLVPTLGDGAISLNAIWTDRECRIASVEVYRLARSVRYHAVIHSSVTDEDNDVEVSGQVFALIGSLSQRDKDVNVQVQRNVQNKMVGLFCKVYRNVIWMTRSNDAYRNSGLHSKTFDDIGALTLQVQLSSGVLALSGVLAFLPALIAVYRTFLIHRRSNRALCVECGYDLRATRRRCPECGRFARHSSK